MTVALALFGYSALVAVGTALLRRGWASRAPRLAIALWQCASVSIIVAAVLGLLALTVPVTASTGLAGLLHACVMALRAGYRTPTGQWAFFLIGLSTAIVVVARLAYHLSAELWRAHRQRNHHLEALTLLGKPDPQLGVTLVDHSGLGAYCVPGRHGRIVLTTAVLATLDDDQIAGVLSHERAHLTGRHHLVLALARAIALAVPLPIFRTAVRELSTLLEMLADDAVAGGPERLTLAAALVTMASGEQLIIPSTTFAASAVCVVTRIRRLLHPRRPLPAAVTVAGAVAALLITAAPVVIAVAPAAAAAGLPYCPISS